MIRAAGLIPLVLLLACSGAADAGPGLHLEMAPAGPNTRLILVPSAGLKLSARLKPALELPGGAIVRFDAPGLTPDSAYFVEPPVATLPGRPGPVHGTLRASVCNAGETVCRSVVIPL